jgi:hypothetical protein
MRLAICVVLGAITLGLTGFAVATGSADANAKACAPGYSPCLPVASDLDCNQIPDAKKPVRVMGSDPYGLDRDRDGVGCEIVGEGGGAKSPWGLILRKPPRKEALSARIGDALTVVGWSPRSARGKRYYLCATTTRVVTCKVVTLRGTVQNLGTWRIKRRQVAEGFFRLELQDTRGNAKASDTVPIR